MCLANEWRPPFNPAGFGIGYEAKQAQEARERQQAQIEHEEKMAQVAIVNQLVNRLDALTDKVEGVRQAGELAAMGSVEHIKSCQSDHASLGYLIESVDVFIDWLGKVDKQVKNLEKDAREISFFVGQRLGALDAAVAEAHDRLDRLEGMIAYTRGDQVPGTGVGVNVDQSPTEASDQAVTGASESPEGDGPPSDSGLGTSDDDSGVLIDIIQGRDPWPFNDPADNIAR